MDNHYDTLSESALTELDALLAGQKEDRWDTFYADRARPCVFFGGLPDENLNAWVNDGTILPGAALDLGCGNGRNAIFLARQGFAVEAVDYSPTAIEWARQRASDAKAQVLWHCKSVFEFEPQPGSFDLVYDSGCFHHIAPHRRHQYVDAVMHALKPGGWFGLTCFRPEGGGGYSDEEVYERRSLGGGLGYTEGRLRQIWSAGFRVHSICQMNEQEAESGLFGKSFLWSLLAQKT